jgi:hypothetical protein
MGRAIATISVLFVAFMVGAAAQTTEDISVAPIECFSRGSADAVRVGEPFTLVLTCTVVETAGTIVVPDQSVLDPAVLQVAPFEVVSGTQPPDVRTSSRRLFQYEYTLRYIGEQFGRDVAVPGVTITYRIQNRGAQGSTLEGRERTYIIPGHQVRILSLLPAAGATLRDPAPATFAAIQQRSVRANAMRIGSIALFVMSGAVAVWALAAALRKPDRQRQFVRRLPSDAAVVRAIRRELAETRRDRMAGGWTPDLAARALPPIRAAATLAAGQAVAMTPVSNGAAAAQGQLVVTSWTPKRTVTLVSGAASANRLESASSFAELREALDVLTKAAYGREHPRGSLDSSLDDALDIADRAASRLQRERMWIRTAVRRVMRARRREEPPAWTR